MDIALVENAENHIHDKDGRENKERQRREELLEDEAFALHFAFDRWGQDLGSRLFNEVRNVPESSVRFGVETKGHGRKLIQVVDRLEAELGGKLGEGADRNERV